MEVLHKGKQWTKKVVCTGSGNGRTGCGAKLLVSQGDLYQTTREFIDDSTSYYTTFYCPCCGAETDIKVPYQIELLGKQPSKQERDGLYKQYNRSLIKQEEYQNHHFSGIKD